MYKTVTHWQSPQTEKKKPFIIIIQQLLWKHNYDLLLMLRLECPLLCITVSLVTLGKIIKIYQGVFHKSFVHFPFDFTQSSGSSCHSCDVTRYRRYHPLLLIFHCMKNYFSVELKTINQLFAEALPSALFRESAHLHATRPPPPMLCLPLLGAA